MKSFRSSCWLTLACPLAACTNPASDPARDVDGVTPVLPDAGAPASDAGGAVDAEAAAPPVNDAYATEKAWAEAHGVAIEVGRTTVIAKRRGGDRRSTTYDDAIVVFRVDGTIVRFVASTKPAQMPNPESSTVPDVDGDGRKDLGIVRPGVYLARGGETFGLPEHERTAFRVVTEAEGDEYLPAWRDLDGDGDFSLSEKSLSEHRGYRMSGILIHYGFSPSGTKVGGSTYSGPWSVGCQNIAYEELDSFVGAVGGASATFRYAIVDD